MARSLALAWFVAALAASALSAQDLDAQVQAIAARLRCPVCQNESLADSPSELSSQMRALIRTKLQSGDSPDQIVAYFVAKYGQWILLEPPRRGMFWLVWVGPLVALGVGLAAAVSFLRRVTRPSALGSDESLS
ncbi:MAG TPA: cytochrome c-type biogenesis protein [bacterium]|nr:cytochrome c-type biogenesis protein [bacterium]